MILSILLTVATPEEIIETDNTQITGHSILAALVACFCLRVCMCSPGTIGHSNTSSTSHSYGSGRAIHVMGHSGIIQIDNTHMTL